MPTVKEPEIKAPAILYISDEQFENEVPDAYRQENLNAGACYGQYQFVGLVRVKMTVEPF